jgi:lysophospholipase L1-like esterase
MRMHSVQLAAMVLAFALIFPTSSTKAQTGQWRAAWATSQDVYGSTTLSNRTVRMFARVTIGGQAVRVRLDNAFSPAPVTFAKVYIGQQAVKRSGDSASRNARLVPGSNRQVFFAGSASVTIPAGGSATSDAVQMNVRASQDLGVSLFVPDSGIRPSSHNAAQTRSYMTANGAGDTAADESSATFTSSTTTMFWLKGIDVLSATSRGAIVAFGDSITDGTCSTFDGHDRWLDWLAFRLASLDGAAAKAVVNEGLSSNTITTIRSNSGVERLDRDVLSHDGVTDVLLFMGTNDINRGASRTQVIAGMQDIINRVRGEGIRIFGATIIPRSDSAWSATKTQLRNDLNQWIRTGGAFDGVVDFDKAMRDPAHVDLLYPPYNCDEVHPTPLGYVEMAKAANLTAIH